MRINRRTVRSRDLLGDLGNGVHVPEASTPAALGTQVCDIRHESR